MRKPSLQGHRPRWRRLVIAILAAVLLGAGGVVLSPGTAMAWDMCKDAPPPVRPDYGTSGLTTGPRNLAEVPDTAPNPFTDTSVPISDVYGYAYRWTNYDLGCGNDFVRDPVAVTTTTAANVILDQTSALLAAVGKLEELSKSSSIDWITGVVATIQAKLSPLVLAVWLPLALMALGAVMIYQSRKAGYGDTFTRMLILGSVVALSTFALVYPYTAAKKTDDVIQFVGQSAQKNFTQSATDTIARESVYKSWLVGNFGSADSATAKEYGPRLMNALTYSWSDVKRIDKDPSAKKSIDAAKATEFKKIAAEVEAKDPGAYESMTGRNDTRQGAALMGAVAFGLMSLFAALAFLMMLLGRIVMQALVIAVPIAGILGVLKFDVLQRLWDLFAAAVIGVFKFTIAAGTVTLVLSALQNADNLGTGVKLLAMAVVTIAAIMLTKPAHTFKAMTPGMKPGRSYLGGIVQRAAGVRLGMKLGADDDKERQDSRSHQMPADVSRATTDGGSRHVQSTMPALPPPPYLASRRGVVEAVPVSGSAAALEGSMVTRHELTAASSAVPTTRWSGLVASSTQSDEQVSPRRAARASEAMADSGAAGSYASTAGRTEDDHATTRPYVVETPLAAYTGEAETGAPRRAEPAAAERLSGRVVYPTGIIVPTEHRSEAGLYRATSRDLSTDGEYVRLPEPQLDAYGHEVPMVTYRSKREREVLV